MDRVSKKSAFNFTLSSRLFISFMSLSIPLLILIGLFLIRVNIIVNLSEKIHQANVSEILDTEVYQLRDVITHWILTGDPDAKIQFNQIWDNINNTKEVWDDSIESMHNEKVTEQWIRLKQLYAPLHQAQLAIMNSTRNPDLLDTLAQYLDKLKPIENQMLDLIVGTYSKISGQREGGLYKTIMAQITSDTHLIKDYLFILKRSAYVLLIIAIVLSIAVPLITLRSIARPLDNAISIAEKIAAGERNIDIKITSIDKLGKMLSSLQTMQYAIKENEEKIRTKEEESRKLFDSLVNSSKNLSKHSSKVAAGDLRERIELDHEDVLLDLGKDLNLMTDSLSVITKKITQVSTDIVDMVETVITSANEQSESITSQASAINEISVSLEEIDKSSKQTMTKAQTLREVAKNTYQQGKLGIESIAESISGIKASEEKMKLIAQTILDLSRHTRQIGEITAVVNTLAQQSKMLGLNAAIEASKAGEAGKGFAAVAVEVKNLAEQSEQSTVQVQKILEDIRVTTEKAVTVTEEGTKSLDSGTKLIEKAGEVMHTLSNMINEASISSQHIEVAIRQETVGIEQIVSSMNEINRTTTTFANGIKEMTAFIHKLDDIAKHLKDDVNIYKV